MRKGDAHARRARGLATLVALGAWLAAGGCAGEERPVVVATTTSLDDTGLLAELVPAFEAEHPDYRLRVVSVGSGEALELGRRGDADLLLVHAPRAEREFMEEGHGRLRLTFLRNDFVIAGPPADPAGVRGAVSAPEALADIAAAGAGFVSRGDNSGTHQRELELWERAGVRPGEGYVVSGQGQAETVRIAGERRLYVLTDLATLVLTGRGLDLEPLVRGDPLLINEYSAIAVSGAAEPEGAEAFARWLLSEKASGIIGSHGDGLFTPLAPESSRAPTGDDASEAGAASTVGDASTAGDPSDAATGPRGTAP